MAVFEMAAVPHFAFMNLLADRCSRSVCAILPNFMAMGQPTAEIWRFLFFEMAAMRHLKLSKFKFLNVSN